VASDPTNELKAMEKALEALEALDGEARERAVAWLAGALGVRPGIAGSGTGTTGQGPLFAGGGSGSSADGGDLGTPKQFLARKAPQTDVERIAVLAYYLTHAREIPHFKTKELSELNLEAAGPRLSNASYAASNATKKSGFLAAAPGGTKQITARGEALVEALPDRAAAKAAIDGMPGKPRRSGSGRRKAKAEE
jgi:hypothetical protein